MARAIVSGPGRRRTSIDLRRATLRRERPRLRGGHGSAANAPEPTAARTHARHTIRVRFAVVAASGSPSTRRRRSRSMALSRPVSSSRRPGSCRGARTRSSVRHGPRPNAVLQIQPEAVRRSGVVGGDHDEAGERFDVGATGTRLPLSPLAGEPCAAPVMELHVVGLRSPVFGFSGDRVETLTGGAGVDEQASIPVSLTTRSE